MIVGCYDMHLYCDEAGCKRASGVPAQYIGQTERECLAKARKDGWRFNLLREAYCPACSKNRANQPKPA